MDPISEARQKMFTALLKATTLPASDVGAKPLPGQPAPPPHTAKPLPAPAPGTEGQRPAPPPPQSEPPAAGNTKPNVPPSARPPLLPPNTALPGGAQVPPGQAAKLALVGSLLNAVAKHPATTDPAAAKAAPSLIPREPLTLTLKSVGDSVMLATPALIRPAVEAGVLKVMISLLGEQKELNVPLLNFNRQEAIPLPPSLANQGELWLLPMPHRLFQLIWWPYGLNSAPTRLTVQWDPTAKPATWLERIQQMSLRRYIELSLALTLVMVLLIHLFS